VTTLRLQIQRLVVPFMESAAQGAGTSIHLASSPALRRVTGRSFADSKPRRSSKASHEEAVADRLWQVSADLVGLPAQARH